MQLRNKRAFCNIVRCFFMKVILGSDHAGFELKQELKEFLAKEKFQTEDVGCFSSESCDYPDFAKAVAEKAEVSTKPITDKRKPIDDAGGESEITGDPTKGSVKDLKPSATLQDMAGKP